MKIQIDTTEKIIKIEETLNLGLFIDEIKKLLPDNKWRNFDLKVEIIHNWSNPIIIERKLIDINPNPYSELPWITYKTNSTNNTEVTPIINAGVYNLEFKN